MEQHTRISSCLKFGELLASLFLIGRMNEVLAPGMYRARWQPLYQALDRLYEIAQILNIQDAFIYHQSFNVFWSSTSMIRQNLEIKNITL
jgi:hypothetical protein